MICDRFVAELRSVLQTQHHILHKLNLTVTDIVVGWVERSETQHKRWVSCLNPTYKSVKLRYVVQRNPVSLYNKIYNSNYELPNHLTKYT